MKTKTFLFLSMLCLCANISLAQNNALEFDGTDDYVVVPDNALLNVSVSLNPS